MNQRPIVLISARAKKFIPSQLFVTNFYFKGTQQFRGCFPNHDWLCHPWPPFFRESKAHNNLQGVFPTMIGFVTLGHLLLRGSCKKRWPRVTKPIMVGKTPCKLLCAFEVKVTSSWLGINFLALVDIRALGR